MSNKKQTAVTFLESTLIKRLEDAGIFISKFDYKLFEQAKAMHKEEIINACNQNEFEDEDNLGIADNLTKGEQYYKENYEL
jgi:hypothetical protein